MNFGTEIDELLNKDRLLPTYPDARDKPVKPRSTIKLSLYRILKNIQLSVYFNSTDNFQVI